MKHSLKAAAAAVALTISAAASAATNELVVQVYDPVSGDTLDSLLQSSVPTTTISSAIVDSIAGYSAFTTGTASVGPSTGFEYTIIGATTAAAGDIGINGTPGKLTITTAGSVFGSGTLTPITNAIASGTTGISGSAGSYEILASGASGSFNTGNQYFGASALVDVNNPTELYYFNGAATPVALGQIAFSNSAGTITLGTTTAVPEPGTYALMAAGLLAVGAIVRRRARG